MNTIFRDAKRIASLSLRTIAGLHLFTSTCFEISQTEGASMLPTVQAHGDFCVVDKRFKNGNGIEMGDIIVARKPTQPDSWVCKRVTGMPGDVVLIDPSRKSIETLREEYADYLERDENSGYQNSPEFKSRFKEIKMSKSGYDRSPYDQFIIVPDGHVWVTGDNLSDSVDSRTYSVMPMGLIGGKIIIGMYLPKLMGFKGEYYRWLANTFSEC